MEPCSAKSQVDITCKACFMLASCPAIKTVPTVSDSCPMFFYVGDSLTRQYLVNNGHHIPHTLCETIDCIGVWINIFPCQSSSYSQKNWLHPKGFLTFLTFRRTAIRLRHGLKLKRQGAVHVSHLLDWLSGWWTQGAHKQGKPWKTWGAKSLSEWWMLTTTDHGK